MIASLIPHAGSMCLLDEVLEWHADRIVCRTQGHLRPDNPLLDAGRLDAIHGLEYGSQAAAIHGALVAQQRAPAGDAARVAVDDRVPGGRIAAFRSATFAVQRLDRVSAPLVVEAHALGGGAGAAVEIYQVRVLANDALLVDGRVTIAFVGTA